MKQKLLCLVMLCLPVSIFSQEGESTHGIKWSEGLSWQQVKEKAKQENKYIFVDCYATWCKPCKQMDKEVYTVDSVGDYLNEKFISLRLQMDVTKNDNQAVKRWRKTAKEIEGQYRITAYPSYVFFAPDGAVVSKAIGYKNSGAFLQVARNATDPAKQYYVLLKKYKQHKLDHTGTQSLITMAQQIGDTADYRNLLNSYYAYLHKQQKENLYTKNNIEFVASTLDRPDMALFEMFYPDGKEVNKVMESDWYSRKVVDKIINNEKVQPFFNTVRGSSEPDWKVLHHTIVKSYGDDFAGRNVLDAKIQWYSSNGDGLRWVRSLNDKIEKYGSDTTDLGEDFRLISAAEIARLNLGRTPDVSKEIITELSRACVWVEGVTRRGEKLTSDYTNRWDMYMDTYANLLYKAGRTADAMKWEQSAIATLKETVKDKETVAQFTKMYEEVLQKIKAGKPTWPIEKAK